jgi:hypothetical protein
MKLSTRFAMIFNRTNWYVDRVLLRSDGNWRKFLERRFLGWSK